MVWYILLGTLAAFGALSVLWVSLGWLLPSGQGCALVCVGVPSEGICLRWKWLRSLGLLRCPLIAVTEDALPKEYAEIEQWGREQLLSRLETERNRFNGTGNGDPPGRHQRRGISEL